MEKRADASASNGTGVLDASSKDIYRYMNFDQIEEYADVASGVSA